MSTEVKFGVVQKLLVTEVAEVGKTLFVQLDTPEAYQVQDLSREIESHVSERNGALANFEPGSRCYAQASDGVLYRALLVNNITSSLATVYFVDYGNSEDVEVSRIFPPSGNFFNLPAQALCCTLGNFIPTQSKWSDAIFSFLVENLLNQEVYGVFRSLSSNPHPYREAVLQDSDKYPCYNITLYQDEAGEVSYSQLLIAVGLGQFAICSESPSVGQAEKVYVAFADSPGCFWLQLSSSTETLESISTALSDTTVISSLESLAQETIFPGGGCCTMFVDDGAYYRAQVIDVGRGGKVKVQFVDYGNSTTVSTTDLFALPPSLCTIPAQAIQCCLDGVRPVKKDWTPESCEVFTNGTVDIELDAKFVDEFMPEVFNVVLRNPETGSTISEMLISSGCAMSSNPTPLISETPPTKLTQAAPLLSPPAELVQATPLISPPTNYTPLAMEVGRTYEISVPFLDSPSVVWGQLVQYQSDFAAMTSKMTSLFKNVSGIPGLKDPAPGQPCAAQFAADKQWYRCRIEAIDKPSKRAQILFVDFGNIEIFKLSSLKQLPSELLNLPMQAISFSMYALTPADGGQVWSPETMSSIVKITSSGVFHCEVVELDSDGYPAVRLKDSQGRDVGEQLVRSKLARWKDDGRKSRSYQQSRPTRDDGTRGSGSRDSSTRGSGSRDSSTRGKDDTTRGSRATPPTQPPRSPHHQAKVQQSPYHSKTLSPIHTGTGPHPQPKTHHYSTEKLEVGQKYTVSVVFVESLQDFYVQLANKSPLLQALMDEIGTHCCSNAARMPGNLNIGMPVLAQFTDDQEWYRAIITQQPSEVVFGVTFVDYGNKDTLQASSLIEIPPSFLSFPAQAIHCSLDGVGVQVSPEAAKTTFTDLTLEQEAEGEVRSFLNDSAGPVYTIDLSLEDGTKPLSALVEGGHISIPRSTLSNLTSTASPTLTEIKFPSFPTHTNVDVSVSYAESPANFYVQLLENTPNINKLAQSMDDVYSKMSQRDEVLFSLNTGVFCAAKFSEDGVWYRARIIDVASGSARVWFVDYGNEDTVAASDLKTLRVQFAAETCLAVRCTLDGVRSEVIQSDDVIQTFSESVINKKLVAKFLKPFSSYSEPVPVQLLDTSQTGSDQDVVTMLERFYLSIGQAQSQDGSAKVTMTPETSTPGATRSEITIPQPKPLLNEPLTCTATHADSPSSIYCQLATSTPLAEALLGEMYTFYAEEDAGKALDSIEIGTICAALFTDGSWYRAKITLLNSDLVTVQYIDYGNSAEVSVSDLRVLDAKFTTDPPHALRCCLNGIRPIESQSDWSKECCERVSGVILDQECQVTIFGEDNDVFNVQLMVTDDDISQVLLRDGFAVTSESSDSTAAAKVSGSLTIPPFSAQVGSEMDVFVTFCESPINLYCQPIETDTQFAQLTEDLQLYCQSQSARAVNINDVIIGDVVLAQYSEDSAWYRAEVLSFSEDGKSLKVVFVDYGNLEVMTSLRVIPAKFCLLPAQAVACSILEGDDYDVNTESESNFNDVLTGDESGFHLKFVEVGAAGERAIVKLTHLSDGSSVLQQACDSGRLVKKKTVISSDEHPPPREKVTAERDGGGEMGGGGGEGGEVTTVKRGGGGEVTTVRGGGGGGEVTTVRGGGGGGEVTTVRGGGGGGEVTTVRGGGKDEVTTVSGGGESVGGKGGTRGGVLEVASAVATRDSGQGVVSTVATWFLPVVMATNTREDGFISHFESPSSFWVQLACNESELESLIERLAAVYSDAGQLAKLDLPAPKPGQVCCAQFSDDKQWYRGTVDVVDSNGVKVHFVDYGNGELVSPNCVKILKQEFIDIPVQATHCSLTGISSPTSSVWPDGSITYFSGLVLENSVTVDFVKKSSLGVWLVKLTCQNEDVATAMVKEGMAVLESRPDGEISTGSDAGEKISLGQPQNFVTTEVAPVIIPELELRVGDTMEVYISHLTNTPTEFYCQLASNEASINELMASVTDFYTENSPPATLEVGAFCVAQYSQNNAWYRAKILNIAEEEEEGEGTVGGRTITVHFVDYGNCESVPPSQVLGLNQNLGALAQQAICCSLSEDMSLVLPQENMAEFLSLDLELLYRVTITRVLSNGRHVVELCNLDGTILNEHILNTASISPSPSSSFHPLSYAVRSTIDVYISSITSPTSFYCQPLQLAADLENMMTELGETVLSKSPPQLDSVSQGMPCLAKFSEDDGWYRARIESISDNGTDNIVAHFVDYGNSEVTSLNALRKCPDHLLKEPIQALNCSVFEASATASVSWTDDQIEDFRAMLGEEPLSLTISSVDPVCGLCVCAMSANGAPIDFTPLLPSQQLGGATELGATEGEEESEQSSQPLVATSNEITSLRQGIEQLSSDQLYASSASSSSLPPTGTTPATSDRATVEQSTSEDVNGCGLTLNSSVDGSVVNASTLALRGSSHLSGDDISETESSEEASDQGGGEGEPLIKAPFTLTLSIPEEFEATIVYVESPSCLYLQRVDCQPELEKLSSEVEQYCTSFAEKQHQEVFQVGDFILAQYSDEAWYRAKVVEVGTDSNVQVFFIDFGNSESISPDKMVMCPENYLELPCQAIACSLANVPHRDSWPDEYKELIDKQVGDKTVRVKVVHPASKGMRPTVNIKVLETSSDIADAVLEYLNAECEIASEIANHNSFMNFCQDMGIEVLSGSLQPVKKKTRLEERKLKIGANYDVYVVACDSPHTFFIHLDTELGKLDIFAEIMKVTYEKMDTSPLTLSAPPAVGDYVASQFSGDSKWYRAKIVSVGDSDPGKVELLFIDYGNSEEREISEIRALGSDMTFPPFAVECFLAGVEPPADVGCFAPEASEHFLKVTGHGECVCKAEIKFVDTAGHYGVNLFGIEEVNVAQSLFDAHLAMALQDTPSTVVSTSATDDVTPDQSEPVSEVAQQLESCTEEHPLSTDESDKKNGEGKDVLSDQFATAYPSHSLAAGTSMNAVITGITSLDEFHCQLIDNLEMLDDLMASIASRHYKIDDNTFAVTHPRKGLPVCACFTEDDIWYRAEIVDVVSEVKVRVRYVDYGNSEELDLTRVKQLETEFAECLPCFIVRCALPPPTDNDLDPNQPGQSEGWPVECLSLFQELVGEDAEVELVLVEGVCGGEGREGEEGGVWRVRMMISEGEVASDDEKSDSGKLDVRSVLLSRLQESSKQVVSDAASGDSVREEEKTNGDGEGGVSVGDQETERQSNTETGLQPDKPVSISSQPEVTVTMETAHLNANTDESSEPELSVAKPTQPATLRDKELDKVAKTVTQAAISDAVKEDSSTDITTVQGHED